MEYALYNGLRTAAQPKLKALCEHCGTEVIAKCGTKKIWHWAHTSMENCDSWYEPETAWHRNWKDVFGERCSEIRIVKENVYHIADVVNKDGIVFEFQNSSISSEMIAAREAFYGEKMIWIINGEAFKSGFRMQDEEFIKNWNVSVLNEFESAQNYPSFHKGLVIEDWQLKNEAVRQLLKHQSFVHVPEAQIYYRLLNGMNTKKIVEDTLLRETEALYEKQKPMQDSTKGAFTWSHPRRSWEDAKRAVFIDFGEAELYWITKGMGKEQGTVVKIRKEKFMEKYGK
jgi:hypothetical protein